MKLHFRYQVQWLKRLFGVGLVIFSLVKLFRNEKEAINISKWYGDASNLRVLPSPEALLPENEGKLVHVSGDLDIPTLIQDYPYGVSVRAVKLKRRVQMYQWVEEKSSHDDDFDDDGYRYRKVWKDKLVDHREFVEAQSHENPTTFPVESEIRTNPHVFLGPFILSDELKDKFRSFTEFTGGERPAEDSGIKMHMGLYYHSADIWKPAIGDLRVQFSFAGLTDATVSVIGKQVGRELKPFEAFDGRLLAYIHEGEKTHLEILRSEYSGKTYEIMWIRVTSLIFIFTGCSFASTILVYMNRRSTLIKHLLDLVPLHFGLILSLALWTTTVGVSWIHFKPVLGVLLLTFSACFLLYTFTPPRHHQSTQFQ